MSQINLSRGLNHSKKLRKHHKTPQKASRKHDINWFDHSS